MTKPNLTAQERDRRDRSDEAKFFIVVFVVLFVALLVANFFTELPATTQPELPQVEIQREFYIPACEFEDSTNCFWDAEVSGNSEGVSFVDIGGTAYYPESSFENVKN